MTTLIDVTASKAAMTTASASMTAQRMLAIDVTARRRVEEDVTSRRGGRGISDSNWHSGNAISDTADCSGVTTREVNDRR